MNECPYCHASVSSLGFLGNWEHFQCRGCGIQFAEEVMYSEYEDGYFDDDDYEFDDEYEYDDDDNYPEYADNGNLDFDNEDNWIQMGLGGGCELTKAE